MKITAPDERTVLKLVVDAKGRTMQQEMQSIIAGTNQIEMNIAELVKAVYTIIITSGDVYRRTMQFVKE